MRKIRFFLLLLIFYSIVVSLDRYYLFWQKTERERISAEQRERAWDMLTHTIQAEASNFKGEAGVVIKDLRSNKIISINEKKLFPSASLAKIPIMIVCFQAEQERKLKLSDSIKLRSADKMAESGILKEVNPGKELTIEDLLEFMVISSDNTATNILTNKLGIGYLNNSFKTNGLKNTNLSRKVADFRARDNGVENYTTAEDMAFILEKIYLRKLINQNVSEKCLKLLKLQQVNDRIPKYLPVDITIAHKTGLERGICHDVGIVFTYKGDFLICVLTRHTNSNRVPAKEFIAKIALHAYNYFM